MTNNKSFERLTPENTAILLIDHQIGTIKLAISTPRDEIIRNIRALARTAVETGMPLVLSSSQEDQFQGLLLEDLRLWDTQKGFHGYRRKGERILLRE